MGILLPNLYFNPETGKKDKRVYPLLEQKIIMKQNPYRGLDHKYEKLQSTIHF